MPPVYVVLWAIWFVELLWCVFFLLVLQEGVQYLVDLVQLGLEFALLGCCRCCEIVAHVLWSIHCAALLRATSHTRLKAHDYHNLRAIIGRKGKDRPSSLHTRRWRPKGPKMTSWMKSLHGVLHGGLWIKFHGLLETVIFNMFFPNIIDFMTDSRIDSKTRFQDR